ncbi:hypothetical protein [Xanthomonas arboricola]|uniref:hypothetical protein n=1 Tax=Xanthomonas arboricola TaxID=56448 RepID=UPI000F8D718B|nr:hypothetical protein [Xanthomonas arboricola]
MIKISHLEGLVRAFSKEAAASTRKTKGMPGVDWIARLLAIAIAIAIALAIARAGQIKCAALDK